MTLRTCPFCGQPVNTGVLRRGGRNNAAGWRVVCSEDYNPEACGAFGPLGKTSDEAVTLWNTRILLNKETLDCRRKALGLDRTSEIHKAIEAREK